MIIQSVAPGPPIDMAMATPAIFPKPTVADNAVVIHDVSVRDSVVHTSYNKLNKTVLDKDKTILTHSPDRITSSWVIASA